MVVGGLGPAGWSLAGGDPAIHGTHPEGIRWVEGFTIQRLMTTNQQYMPFLEDLVAQGREADVQRIIPRERVGDGVGRTLYGRRPDGGFTLGADAAGDRWDPALPVVMIPFEAALAFCEWMRDRTNIDWRLPRDLEWEKAARGVDGRSYPWGDFFEPTWCRARGSRPGRPLPAVVGRYLGDESVYGVRDMAGNVRDWCADPWPDASPGIEPRRLIRGGYYKSSAFDACANYRDFVPETTRFHALGFRLARSLG